MTTAYWLEKAKENAERLIGWAKEFMEAIQTYLDR